jgi:ribosomal protein L7/L12
MQQSHDLPPVVLDALQEGNPILAIKRLRELTGMGLKEAKDAVEAHLAGLPVDISGPAYVPQAGPLTPPMISALQRGDRIEAIKLMRCAYRLGLKEAKDAVEAWIAANPGRVPPQTSNGGAGWLALLLLGGLAGAIYYFFLS